MMGRLTLDFQGAARIFPDWCRSVTTPADGLGSSDLAHGVVEGQPQHLDMEVNGITGEVTFRPAPVAVFDDETGIGWQNKIARLALDQLQAALLQQRHQRGQARGADLLARPARAFKRGAGHSLFSSGVG